MSDALLTALRATHKPASDLIPELKHKLERIKAERDELRITVSKQQETIRKLKEERRKTAVNDPKMREIKESVACYFEVTTEQLDSKSRHKLLVYPRQIAMYLCRHLTKRSYPEIGRFFGRRDHTTALHAERKIGSAMREDWTVAYDVAHVEELI